MHLYAFLNVPQRTSAPGAPGTHTPLRLTVTCAPNKKRPDSQKAIQAQRTLQPQTLLELRPIPLVGLDHIVEDLLGDLHRRHGLVQRKRLECLLVGALDGSLHNKFL